MTNYDVIVVGAGIEGSATAYHLAKTGKKTLLIEKFPLPHTRGSSHGASRIIRKAYDTPIYSQMMIEAYKRWEKLEKEADEQLMVPTGMVRVSWREELERQARMMKGLGLSCEIWSGTELRRRFPTQLNHPDHISALFDPDAGILRADKCLRAFQDEFRRSGGTIRDGEPVESVVPGVQIRVRTSKNVYTASAVVLCLGPWAGKFLLSLDLQLPLVPQVVKVCYWESSDPEAYAADKGFPCYICSFDDNNSFTDHDATTEAHCYGLPSLEYPGLFKFCCHAGPEADPDRRDTVSSEETIEILKNAVKEHFPLLKPDPVIVDSCFYTWTPDHNFILDRHPQFKNIVIGAGFSGHGFKLAPVVGKVLGNLAVGKSPEYDISLFRIDRFRKKTASSKI